MLYIGQNEWTHVNCALWSAEVFEDDDGSLKNVHMAVIRGKQLVRPGVNVMEKIPLSFQMFYLWLHDTSLRFYIAFRMVSQRQMLVYTVGKWLL